MENKDLNYYDNLLQKQINLINELQKKFDDNELKINNLKKNLYNDSSESKNSLSSLESAYNRQQKINSEIQHIANNYDNNNENIYINKLDKINEKINIINSPMIETKLLNSDSSIKNLVNFSKEISELSENSSNELNNKIKSVGKNLIILKELLSEKNINHNNIEVIYDKYKKFENHISNSIKEAESLNLESSNFFNENKKYLNNFNSISNIENLISIKETIWESKQNFTRYNKFLNKEFEILNKKFLDFKTKIPENTIKKSNRKITKNNSKLFDNII